MEEAGGVPLSLDLESPCLRVLSGVSSNLLKSTGNKLVSAIHYLPSTPGLQGAGLPRFPQQAWLHQTVTPSACLGMQTALSTWIGHTCCLWS